MPTGDWYPTLLGLDGIDYPDWAMRGLSVTLTPIAMGELRRDVMGGLVDMTLEQFRKYAITITCTDLDAPELTDVWRGKDVVVTLIAGLGVENSSAGPLVLQTKVDTWESGRDEWAAQTNWTLTLLED